MFTIGQLVWLPRGAQPGLFVTAVDQAIGEAEILHVRFGSDESGPFQFVPESDACVQAEHGRPVPFDGGEDELRSAARERVCRTISLDEGRPYESTVWVLDDGRAVWEFTAHHILLDAYGVSLLTRRVAELYTSSARGDAPGTSWFGNLADAPREESRYESSPRWQADHDFWTGREVDADGGALLSAAPALTLPVEVSEALDRTVADSLAAIAESVGGTWADALIGIWGLYIAALRGEEDVVLGVPLMARRGNALRTPMMQANILPLHLRPAPGVTVSEWIGVVSEKLTAIRRHQRYRGENLAVASGGHRVALPQVNLKIFDYELDFAGLVGIPESLAPGPVDDLNLIVYNDSVHGRMWTWDIDSASLRAAEEAVVVRDGDSPSGGSADVVSGSGLVIELNPSATAGCSLVISAHASVADRRTVARWGSEIASVLAGPGHGTGHRPEQLEELAGAFAARASTVDHAVADAWRDVYALDGTSSQTSVDDEGPERYLSRSLTPLERSVVRDSFLESVARYGNGILGERVDVDTDLREHGIPDVSGPLTVPVAHEIGGARPPSDAIDLALLRYSVPQGREVLARVSDSAVLLTEAHARSSCPGLREGLELDYDIVFRFRCSEDETLLECIGGSRHLEEILQRWAEAALG